VVEQSLPPEKQPYDAMVVYHDILGKNANLDRNILDIKD
jgi:hypothetical protein